MAFLVRARVLLTEAEALGLAINDLVGRLTLADDVSADPGRLRRDGGADVPRPAGGA